MRLLAVSLALGLLLVPVVSAAQEDTTPPVVIAFTFSPTTFDAGSGAVSVQYCITVADDLSGLGPPSLVFLNDAMGFQFRLSDIAYPPGQLQATVCESSIIPQFFPYADYGVVVTLQDAAGNFVQWGNADLRCRRSCATPAAPAPTSTS